jgi:hypothetical protein
MSNHGLFVGVSALALALAVKMARRKHLFAELFLSPLSSSWSCYLHPEALQSAIKIIKGRGGGW